MGLSVCLSACLSICQRDVGNALWANLHQAGVFVSLGPAYNGEREREREREEGMNGWRKGGRERKGWMDGRIDGEEGGREIEG